MDSSKFKAIIVAVLAMFAALYLGISAATAQFETIAWVVGGLVVSTCVILGRRIWLLIPFTTALLLKFYYLPGSPDAAQLGQIAFLLFSALLFLMRRLRMGFQFTELEGWSLLLLVCVLQVYLRNPTGLSLFGSANVGGKPYFNFGMAFLTACSLSLIIVPPNELKWLVRLTMIASLLSFCIGLVGRIAPMAGYWLGAPSAEAMAGEDLSQIPTEAGAADRKQHWIPLAGPLARWIGSVKAPLLACVHPLYGTLILISFGAAAFSGYRNQIVIVVLTYVVAQFYRSGFKSVLFCSILGAMGVLMLSVVNSMVPLPPNVQRVMTIFPGSWEQRYKDDAKGSTEWRTEMWIEALTNKRYIANTLIGDGLGMTAFQLEQSQILSEKKAKGMTGWDLHRETVMINGDFHSGPVQTIKMIGYFGLLILLIGMIRLAVHAHRQIQRCRGTEWYSTALFIGIPLIWSPIYFVFVFGSFSGGALGLLIGSGLIRILEKSLPLPVYVPFSRRNAIPMVLAARQRTERAAESERYPAR